MPWSRGFLFLHYIFVCFYYLCGPSGFFFVVVCGFLFQTKTKFESTINHITPPFYLKKNNYYKYPGVFTPTAFCSRFITHWEIDVCVCVWNCSLQGIEIWKIAMFTTRKDEYASRKERECVCDVVNTPLKVGSLDTVPTRKVRLSSWFWCVKNPRSPWVHPFLPSLNQQ